MRIRDPGSGMETVWIRDKHPGSATLVFCLFLPMGTLTLVFKHSMSLRSHKTVGIMIYLNIFAFWWKDPDP